SGELESFDEAMQVESTKEWERGMNEEMESLEKNQTWDLVKLLAGKRVLQKNGST
ncbi:hypothetical protein KI387_011982, partial [Taxus chinensis]